MQTLKSQIWLISYQLSASVVLFCHYVINIVLSLSLWRFFIMEIVDAVESVPSPNAVPSTFRLKTSQTSFEKLTLELSLDLCGCNFLFWKAWVWSDKRCAKQATLWVCMYLLGQTLGGGGLGEEGEGWPRTGVWTRPHQQQTPARPRHVKVHFWTFPILACFDFFSIC